MAAIIVLLALAILFGGLGFALHFLWIIAGIILVLWLIGFFIGGVGPAGGRRRYWGRW